MKAKELKQAIQHELDTRVTLSAEKAKKYQEEYKTASKSTTTLLLDIKKFLEPYKEAEAILKGYLKELNTYIDKGNLSIFDIGVKQPTPTPSKTGNGKSEGLA